MGGLGWLNIASGVGEAHFWLTLLTGALGVYFGTAGAELGGRPAPSEPPSSRLAVTLMARVSG